MFERLDDTIVAISSAPGNAPRGIIRLSGPAAHTWADRVFEANNGSALADAGGRRRYAGRAWIDEDAAVPSEAYSFRAPASYTRQDLVELHTIGARPVLAMLLDRLTALGARPAEPGEFTARAFFAGAMDLTCVEGVAALIAAHNDAQLRASHALLHGRLSRQTSSLRAQLADLLALVEADIDFAEEPVDFLDLPAVAATLDSVIATLSALVHESTCVERLDALPTVMLTGPPNAGKSTLFNRLTGMDRVIASAAAGTTRDIIASPLKLADGEVSLLDSAGLATLTSDALERLAEQMARRQLVAADVVVVVADVNGPPADALDLLQDALAERLWCIAVNKIDTVLAVDVSAWVARAPRPEAVIPVSARTGQGVSRLAGYLNSLVFTSSDRALADRLALSSRQRNALREALHALEAARLWCAQSDARHAHTELLAVPIREAVESLGLLEGRMTTDDLLNRIFSRFCIGK